jgi:hypothetical protein
MFELRSRLDGHRVDVVLLEQAGIAERQRGRLDRRAVQVHMTRAGHPLHGRLLKAVISFTNGYEPISATTTWRRCNGCYASWKKRRRTRGLRFPSSVASSRPRRIAPLPIDVAMIHRPDAGLAVGSNANSTARMST